MKKNKRIICAAIALCLVLALCACGSESGSTRTIEKLGVKVYGVAFRQGDKVSQSVCRAMDELNENGTLSLLSIKWLNEDLIDYSSASFPEETAELEEGAEAVKRTLVVGVEAALFPLSYTNSTGGTEGLCADIALALGEKLGWEIKLLPLTSLDLKTQLNSGNIDVAIGIGTEVLSSDSFTLGPTFLKSNVVLVSLSDSKFKSLRSLEGEMIGSSCDMSAYSALTQSENIAKYTNLYATYGAVSECFDALKAEVLAAVVTDELTLRYNFDR